MSRRILPLLIILLAWLATGFFVVRGNEQAVVRRFGRVVPGEIGSGLHYTLPWPLATVDRIDRHAVRTVTIGVPPPTAEIAGGFLREINADRQAEFLTGDKNILNLQVNIQYVIDEPVQYLFATENPDRALQALAESYLADAIARSGVDYVHPLGLNELREILLRGLQQSVDSRAWGLAVEDVTIAGVYPPVEVKAAFLDVSNARAEKERMIQEEQTRGEQAVAIAKARSNQLRTEAESNRTARVTAAHGSADRFRAVLAQFRKEAESGNVSYETVRSMTLQRLYATTLETVLPKLGGKVFLDGGKPVDLTIVPAEGARAAPAPQPLEGLPQ